MISTVVILVSLLLVGSTSSKVFKNTNINSIDPQINPAYLGFQSLPLDFQPPLQNLPVISGKVPAWLSGSLFRNGPANFDAINASHWFYGLAMLSAFHFKDGKVEYISQFVRKYAGESVSEDYSPNSMVTIRNVDGHFLTNTAVTPSNEFDPVTLDTLAAPFQYDDDGSIPITTAPEHAYTDPTTGEILHFYLVFSPDPAYHIYTIAPGTNTRKVIGTIPVNPAVQEPLYQHSFGVTEHYIIMSEVPCTYGSQFSEYEWIPELGVTWRVISRTTGDQIGTFSSNSFFMFHHINAYEDHKLEMIHVDLITYPDNTILDAFYLEDILYNWTWTVDTAFGSQAMRYSLPLRHPGSHVAGRLLSSLHAIEMPIVNPNLYEKSYQYFFGISISSKSATWFDQIFKVDISTGQHITWQEQDCYPIEPLFIPRRTSFFKEDDGVLMSVVLDAKNDSSFLLILEASDLQEIARIGMPYSIPFGFHGDYAFKT